MRMAKRLARSFRAIGGAVSAEALEAIRAAAYPLPDIAVGYNPLLEAIGDARFVLLGEATHGTHEFYRARAIITERLIREKGFTAVAIEADWPYAHTINRYVRGGATTGREALSVFRRFPVWMWRNTDMLRFVEVLRSYNDALPPGATRVGIYGLDLYSLHASIEAILDYLQETDPEEARQARERYSCFEHFGLDPHAYGYDVQHGYRKPCRDEVIDQLRALQRRSHESLEQAHGGAADDLFYAAQNARLVQNAEAYYRAMYGGRASAWNLRDTHMADTLDALVTHLDQQGPRAKVVIWAHNTHLGDARATQLGEEGELNVGQLVRERHGNEAFLVGFSTYTGTVRAASRWGSPGHEQQVLPALRSSYEALFHDVGIHRFLLLLNDAPASVLEVLRKPRLERAIGVVYRPRTERTSHYFYASLAEQFDAILHFDETRAVEPLASEADAAAPDDAG